MIPGLLLDKRAFIYLAVAVLLAVQVYFAVTVSMRSATPDDRERPDCGADRMSPQCFR